GSALADCTLAVEKRPGDGDALGRLAMFRLVQGQNADDALALANRGIESRSAVANYVMGLMYERGLRLQRDIPRAGTYYRVADELGLARATGSLCLLGIDMINQPGGGVTASLSETIGWCDAANSENDVLGMIGKAHVLESGLGGQPMDAAGAAALYQQAADRGNDEAAVRLGILYHRGLGVAQDMLRAVSLYRQAAAHDDPAGLRSLGISYELGEGVIKDELEAARLYEKASIRRDIPALLLAGYAVEQSIIYTSRVVRDIEMLAASPLALTAQRMRGQLYTRGLMRLTDAALAESEFSACAGTGNQLCIVALGNFYEFGVQTAKQPEKAAIEYERAAQTGNLLGQYWWAYALDWGVGVARDQARAIELYRLAAAQGQLSSINRLAQLGQPTQ
ncbi:MAG: tetratricopeptide repeat protein, partial [Devosia sp.]